MEQRNPLVLTLGAAATGVSYYYLVVTATGYAGAVLCPKWWWALFPTHSIGAMAWAESLNTLAMLLAAIPVAIAAVALFARRSLLLCGVGAALAVGISLYPTFGPSVWPLVTGRNVAVYVLDALKMLAVLPLFALALQRGPLTIRLERP